MSEWLHTFRSPTAIFGRGAVDRVGEAVAQLGRRALLITGARSADAAGTSDRIKASLKDAGAQLEVLRLAVHEPTDTMVDTVRETIKSHGCDVVIGLGGGSAMDLAKAAAGLYFSPSKTHAHMIDDAPIPGRALPWIAVPTTAGSGSEMTPNAVLTDTKTGIKKSLRSWSWLADVAIVDPELTVTVPPSITAYTGMDALTQAIESYTSTGATPLTDGICLEAAQRIGTHLPTAFDDGKDLVAREAVAWGSMMAGLALSNARLGAVHGFAHPVGTHCQLPHGKACAILLPSVMEFNASVVGEKYHRLALALGLVDQGASVDQGVDALIGFIRKLGAKFDIPGKLSESGLREEMFPSIIEETLPSGSLAANPRQATRDDLVSILKQHL